MGLPVGRGISVDTVVPRVLREPGIRRDRGTRGMASFLSVFCFFYLSELFFSSYNLVFILKSFQTHRIYSCFLHLLVQTYPVISGHTCLLSQYESSTLPFRLPI